MDNDKLETKVGLLLNKMDKILAQQEELIADDMEEEALQNFAALSQDWNEISADIDRIVAESKEGNSIIADNPAFIATLQDMDARVALLNNRLEQIFIATTTGIRSAREQQTAIRSYGGMNSVDQVSLYFDKKQ